MQLVKNDCQRHSNSQAPALLLLWPGWSMMLLIPRETPTHQGKHESLSSKYCLLDRFANCTYFLAALVDLGSITNMISKQLVKDLYLPILPCTTSLWITAMDSQPISIRYITHIQYLSVLSLKISLFHTEEIL